MFRLVSSSKVVCLGYYCLINERVEIALRSYEILTIMLFSGTKKKKELGDGFSHSHQSREPQRINVLVCMRERRVERKGTKAALFLCLTVPRVGFVWWKVIIIYLQIKWTHVTCSYAVLPRKTPSQSLFANVLWQAKLLLLKKEQLCFRDRCEQAWVRERGKEVD